MSAPGPPAAGTGTIEPLSAGTDSPEPPEVMPTLGLDGDPGAVSAPSAPPPVPVAASRVRTRRGLGLAPPDGLRCRRFPSPAGSPPRPLPVVARAALEAPRSVAHPATTLPEIVARSVPAVSVPTERPEPVAPQEPALSPSPSRPSPLSSRPLGPTADHPCTRCRQRTTRRRHRPCSCWATGRQLRSRRRHRRAGPGPPGPLGPHPLRGPGRRRRPCSAPRTSVCPARCPHPPVVAPATPHPGTTQFRTPQPRGRPARSRPARSCGGGGSGGRGLRRRGLGGADVRSRSSAPRPSRPRPSRPRPSRPSPSHPRQPP